LCRDALANLVELGLQVGLTGLNDQVDLGLQGLHRRLLGLWRFL
jgi:hypothetical protein